MPESKKDVGLYVHIPFCSSKCDYCDFFSVAESGSCINDGYIRAVLNESLFYAKKLNIQMWSTIYIGGGTPSIMSAGQIKALLDGLKKSAASCEMNPLETTIEMNPQSITEEKLCAACSGGAGRLSIGLQSFTQKALDAVNRGCTAKTAEKAMSTVKKNWNGKLSLDCMAGLPCQNMNEFTDSLEKIISYDPDHNSLYTLTVEEGTALFRRIENGMDFDFDEADRQWLEGRSILEKNGFRQYEVSNFALPGNESIHNSSYWKQKDYVGIGAGATGTLYDFSPGKKGFRWTNTKDIKKYIEFWNGNDISEEKIPRETELLDSATEEFEYLMTGLRTMRGLEPEEYRERFQHLKWKGDLRARLGADDGAWKKFSERGMCADFESTGRYALNGKGILFLNPILEEYL